MKILQFQSIDWEFLLLLYMANCNFSIFNLLQLETFLQGSESLQSIPARDGIGNFEAFHAHLDKALRFPIVIHAIVEGN